MSIKIAITGNCQARSLAHILQEMLPDVEITVIGIVHLLKSEEEPNYVPYFEQADIIFAQRVTDNYPCTFVRVSDLKAKYGAKVISYPNLYYTGYNPELTCLRDTSRKPLGGPLGDYHNRTFFNAWKEGLSVKDALRRNADIDYNREAYIDIPENSMLELKQREAETDVRIVDWIAEHIFAQRLFFTFNHPAQALINELAMKLLYATGADISSLRKTVLQKESLDQFSCPINPYIVNQFNLNFDNLNIYSGVDVVNIESGNVITGRRRKYQPQEIVEAFFNVYEFCGL